MQSRGPAPRQLPWADWEEWDHVRRGLFSESAHSKEWAVGVVSMWRRRGRVPHAVESTAQLLEIGLGDPVSDLGGGRADRDLRLSYSLAVVRAVNGLVDPQQQNYFAGSVLALAAKIGIPGWIVELRHDATHNEMPSLSVLRNAALTLLAWYERNYWLQQAEHLRGLSAGVSSALQDEAWEADQATTGAGAVAGERQRPEKKFLAVTSFSHIIIPQLISDIAFFELDCPPGENKLFDIFCLQQRDTCLRTAGTEVDMEASCRELCAWFADCRWKTSVDDVLLAAPEWGLDCLLGNAVSKILVLLSEINAYTLAISVSEERDGNADGNTNSNADGNTTGNTNSNADGNADGNTNSNADGNADIIHHNIQHSIRQTEQCQWRAFVLACLAVYAAGNAGRQGNSGDTTSTSTSASTTASSTASTTASTSTTTNTSTTSSSSIPCPYTSALLCSHAGVCVGVSAAVLLPVRHVMRQLVGDTEIHTDTDIDTCTHTDTDTCTHTDTGIDRDADTHTVCDTVSGKKRARGGEGDSSSSSSSSSQTAGSKKKSISSSSRGNSNSNSNSNKNSSSNIVPPPNAPAPASASGQQVEWPLVWPLGCMPACPRPRLYQIEEDFAAYGAVSGGINGGING
jgi:hypothetical protein